MMYTNIGAVAGFLMSSIALALVIKNDIDREEWNRMHKRYPRKKKSLFKWGLVVYFIAWIVVSLYSWYFLDIIELGKFFAFAVVCPALLASGFKLWVE